MASEETPEIGDKVSWNWNGAQPGGEVSEKKTEGEVSVQSKRGNTIKKSAQPDDPAIALSRPGNDVVKNQSELQVDEKTSKEKEGGAEDTEMKDSTKEDEGADATGGKYEGQEAKVGQKEDAQTTDKGEVNGAPTSDTGDEKKQKKQQGIKRKATSDPSSDAAAPADKKRGRPKGATNKEKKPEAADANEKPAKKTKAAAAPAKEKKSAPAAKEKKAAAAQGEAGGEKKARGRPKGPPKPEKEKKPKKEKPEKPKAPPVGVGKRTRSQG